MARETRTTGRGRSRALNAALALAIGVAVGLAPVSTAVADPTNPSAQDVQAAQQAVTAKAAEIAQIEFRLAEVSAVSDTAWQKVQIAGEAYTQALVDRDAAAATAAETTARLAEANAAMDKARKVLVGIALQSARNGGSFDMAEAVLVAGGFQEVVARTTALQRLGAKADDAAQSFQAAKIVADTLKQRATAALATKDATATAAEQALAAAQQAQSDAEAAVAAAAAQRDTLIAQLAVVQQTSVAIEKARQDQLDAERAARAEAAAKAARLAPPVSTTPVATPPTATPPPTTTPPTTTQPPTTTVTPPPVTTPPVTTPPVSSDPYGLGTGVSRGSAAAGEAAVAWAKTQLGLPYGWGATGPGAYDCSGLVMRAWQYAGVSLNRTTMDQYRQVKKISYDSLRVGDLIFWGWDANNPDSVTHVALWLGNGQILEAPRTGLDVRITSMRWSGTMPFAGRP